MADIVKKMDDVSDFIAKIKSPDTPTRYGAQKTAGPMSAAAIAPLSDLMTEADKPTAKAAKGALDNIAHYSARPGAKADARAVTLELLKVAQSPRPVPARAHALHLLGFTADGRAAPALTKLLAVPDVHEEARMALQRLPGSASANALRK